MRRLTVDYIRAFALVSLMIGFPVLAAFTAQYWPSGTLITVRLIAVVMIPVAGVFVFRMQRERRRWRRRSLGQCSECGYDLRAHAKGERCPECGSVVKA